VPIARTVRDPAVTRAQRVVTFTTDQIAAYAQASGDHNPIHADADFARSVGLPGVIAHGMLQMGILSGVASEAAGGPKHLRRLYCRFAGMVEPGDTVTFAADDAGPGKLALTALNQRGEPILTKASAEYL
jgi:acyl dehydratase